MLGIVLLVLYFAVPMVAGLALIVLILGIVCVAVALVRLVFYSGGGTRTPL